MFHIANPQLEASFASLVDGNSHMEHGTSCRTSIQFQFSLSPLPVELDRNSELGTRIRLVYFLVPH